MKQLFAAASVVAVTFGTAGAVTITPDFTFEGSIQIEGGAVENFGPEYPMGVIRRDDSTSDIVDSFATISGEGFDDPVDGVTFTNGANAFGEARASSNSVVTVQITNDAANAKTLVWNGTIIAGGAGIVAPDLIGECSTAALDQCNNYFAGVDGHGAQAELMFGATLDGSELFSGEFLVNDTVQTANFSGIALENLRLAPGNSEYYWWDETDFTIELGTFDPGETKTLEFMVMSNVIASGNDGCFVGSAGPNEPLLICTGAQAGFGDPDTTGGINHFSARSLQTISYSEQISEIPVPAAAWLFGTVLAGAFGARRLRKAK